MMTLLVRLCFFLLMKRVFPSQNTLLNFFDHSLNLVDVVAGWLVARLLNLDNIALLHRTY